MRSSGRSATSGSRLFWIIRKAASCGHPRQCKELPRGARTTRAVTVILLIVRLAAVHAIRTDLRDQGGVPRERRDQALLERRLFDQLQPVLHEDPAQTDLVGESCRLRWRVRRRDVVEVDARKTGPPAECEKRGVLSRKERDRVVGRNVVPDPKEDGVEVANIRAAGRKSGEGRKFRLDDRARRVRIDKEKSRIRQRVSRARDGE